MRIRRTRRARAYLIAIACAYAAAVLLASHPLAVLAVVGTLAYAHLRWAFGRELRRLALRVERSVLEPLLYSDQVVHVSVSLRGENPARLRIDARDVPPEGWSVAEGSLEARGEPWGALPEWRYGVRPAGRGSWRFGGVHAVASDAHGLFQAVEELSAPLEVRVNASIAAVQRGRAYARKKPFDPRRKASLGLIFRDYEYEGIREYQGGDRLRDIDWKSTTRLNEMMTKTFERELEGIVYCLVDASRSMRERAPGTQLTKLDHAAELVLQVGEIAGQRNFQLGMIVFDETGILVEVPASRSKGQERILAQRILALPNSLDSKRRLDAAAFGARAHDASEEPFLERIGLLRHGSVLGGASSARAKSMRRGGSAAAARIMAQHPSGSIFAFAFSDFATDPDALSQALLRMRAQSHKVAVGLLPDDRYLTPPASPTVRDVENAYLGIQARRRALHLLRSRGAFVQELEPKKTISALVEERA